MPDLVSEMTINDYFKLFGYVIRQAYTDVKEYNARKKRIREGIFLDNSNRIKAQIELRESRDAIDFFESNRLEDFIRTHSLPLDAEFLRNEYFKISPRKFDKSNK